MASARSGRRAHRVVSIRLSAVIPAKAVPHDPAPTTATRGGSVSTGIRAGAGRSLPPLRVPGSEVLDEPRQLVHHDVRDLAQRLGLPLSLLVLGEVHRGTCSQPDRPPELEAP